MYHSIFFDSWNTYDDWHIVPTSRPLFAPPALKTTTLSIPGANGVIDLSDSLTKYPVFENRKGSIEFHVLNGYGEWYERYSTISNLLHGQKMRAILEDELDYYYTGRFTVNAWKSEKDRSKITINYEVEPYKYLVRSSLDFGIYSNIGVDEQSETVVTFTKETYGYAPICPKFIVETSQRDPIYLRFENPTLGIDINNLVLNPGATILPEVIFYGPQVTCHFTMEERADQGVVSIDFHKGSL